MRFFWRWTLSSRERNPNSSGSARSWLLAACSSRNPDSAQISNGSSVSALPSTLSCCKQLNLFFEGNTAVIVDGRVAGHLGAANGLKTLSIHVCVCPHFGM